MDCVIPGPSVRLFCSSIACLSKIGKDLYVELDVAQGVTLRTLNDAKSAYACMRFAPSFFERCSAPSQHLPSRSSRRRPRGRRAASSPSTQTARSTTAATNSDEDDEEKEERRFSVRLAVRAMAPVVRARKDVVQLRITSLPSPLRLAFEFLLRAPSSDGGAATALLRVVHGIPACDADAVSAVTDLTRASELSCRPSALLRLLEPLSRLKTTEVALIVEKDAKVLSAQSFHHGECYGLVGAAGGSANANTADPTHHPLQHRHTSHVKTEACLPMDELDDFYFHDTRGDGAGEEAEGTVLPDRVNEGVVLVVPLREARAWLQFCASHADTAHVGRCATASFHWGGRPVVLEASSSSGPEDGNGNLGDPTAAGRSRPPSFSSQLVLASLDHHLLRGG